MNEFGFGDCGPRHTLLTVCIWNYGKNKIQVAEYRVTSRNEWVPRRGSCVLQEPMPKIVGSSDVHCVCEYIGKLISGSEALARGRQEIHASSRGNAVAVQLIKSYPQPMSLSEHLGRSFPSGVLRDHPSNFTVLLWRSRDAQPGTQRRGSSYAALSMAVWSWDRASALAC